MTRLLALLLALAGGPAAGATPASAPDTVAVLYFHNQGNPALEPLKVGLAQMLITDLGAPAGRTWTVVERSQLQAILDELELGHSGVVDPDTAARVGRLLGAEWLVLGSYFELVGTLRVDARLVRVETGEIAWAAGADGGVAEFRRLEQELAQGLGGALAARAKAPTDAAGEAAAGEAAAGQPASGQPAEDQRASGGTTQAGAPGEVYVSGGPAAAVAALAGPDPEALDAAVAFSEGLILLDRHEVQRAREAFEQALAKDPALEAARAQLAGLDL